MFTLNVGQIAFKVKKENTRHANNEKPKQIDRSVKFYIFSK